MPASNARIQVTVDAELRAALDAVDPSPASRSRLVRDLALRGAQEVRDEEERRAAALETLLKLSNGELNYDFAALHEVLAERENDAL